MEAMADHAQGIRIAARPGRGLILRTWPILLGWVASAVLLAGAETVEPIRLLTLEPGHFHAALFQKEKLPEVSEQAHVYARLGPDLTAHLNRIAQFNARPQNPTCWQLEVHACPNPLERMLAERPGNVAILSGNNRGKIDCIAAIVRAGLHVLADKPWIIEPEDLPRLEAALEAAEKRRVAAYDGMTERFEITWLLARALVNEADVFGVCQTGSPAEPGVRIESLHYFLKEVAGAPLSRPAWFFDVRQQGEGLADVGTHLVDLVQWTLFPDQAIDYRRDIAVLQGSHSLTRVSLENFQRVTGEKGFPADLREAVREGVLECYANNTVTYRLRGVFVRLDIRWDVEAAPGAKDTKLAVFSGSRARVEVRQGREEQYVPEVYVTPARGDLKGSVLAALSRKIESLQPTYPGLALKPQGDGWRLVIPNSLQASHEDHFAVLTTQFLNFVRDPGRVPAWERPNMLAKYFVTTQGVRLARENEGKSRP